jgi:predicted ABC-type exoprotein transport system permease subunit
MFEYWLLAALTVAMVGVSAVYLRGRRSDAPVHFMRDTLVINFLPMAFLIAIIEIIISPMFGRETAIDAAQYSYFVVIISLSLLLSKMK